MLLAKPLAGRGGSRLAKSGDPFGASL